MYKSYRGQVEKKIDKVINAWLWRSCKAIQSGAKRNAPRFTGGMAKSIKIWVKNFVGRTFVNVPYGRFVEGVDEYGKDKITKRHFVSWDRHPAFKRWARRVYGADTSRPGGLLVWGYATKFFRNAIKSAMPRIKSEYRRMRI